MALAIQNSIVVRPPPGSNRLEDNVQWCNRFEIHSESSSRVYIIAQNKQSGKYGCSCPGFLSHRKCKHLIDGCRLLESQIHGRDRIVEQKQEKMNHG